MLALSVVAFALAAEPQTAADVSIVVIRVPVSSPKEAARVLDEIFNGTGETRRRRIVVFFLPGTRSVVVIGSRVDILTARELLSGCGRQIMD